MDPELFKVFAEEFHREVNRLRMVESARYDAAHAELERIERRLRKLVDAIAEGVPGRTLKEEILALEARQDELRALLENGEGPREPLLHPNLAEIYRQKVAALNEALEHESTQAEAMDLIRSLVDEIELTPEDGELRIDLKGELAGILNLCTESKKPGPLSGTGLTEQVKMVAGARNHLYLLLMVSQIPKVAR